MSFQTWANGVWIRMRYSFETETRPVFLGEQERTVERITAKIETQGADSQTVKAAIGGTLPTIKYAGGNDTLSGTTGWTAKTPQLEDIGGGNMRVTVTWEKTGSWS